jgi:hypothetical protein
VSAEATTAAAVPERRLYDVLGAVAYLHSLGADTATPNFVRSIISSGAVAHVRIGKKFFVSRESLDGWIQKHERRSRP